MFLLGQRKMSVEPTALVDEAIESELESESESESEFDTGRLSP